LQKIFTDYNRALTVVDIDAYINQAKEILLENYSAIVEKNRTLADKLKSIEVKHQSLEKLSTNSKSTIFKLPSNHYTTLNRYCYGKALDCEFVDSLFVNDIQTHKIEESLRDVNVQPNFNWRETFSNEDSKGLHIYHGGIMEIEEAFIDYLRWIPDVAYYSGVSNGLYINQDGETVTEDKHLMIDNPIVWRKIVDIVEYLIEKDLKGNPKIPMETILFNEKVYIN
jgi:hypothetical protein